jgi:hypothetical protein
MMKGVGDNKAIQVVESVDTAGQPEPETIGGVSPAGGKGTMTGVLQ